MSLALLAAAAAAVPGCSPLKDKADLVMRPGRALVYRVPVKPPPPRSNRRAPVARWYACIPRRTRRIHIVDDSRAARLERVSVNRSKLAFTVVTTSRRAIAIHALDLRSRRPLWSTDVTSESTIRVPSLLVGPNGAAAFALKGGKAPGVFLLDGRGARALDRRPGIVHASLASDGRTLRWKRRRRTVRASFRAPLPKPPRNCARPPAATVLSRTVDTIVYEFRVRRSTTEQVEVFGCHRAGPPRRLAGMGADRESLAVLAVRGRFVYDQLSSRTSERSHGGEIRVHDLQAGTRLSTGCRSAVFTGDLAPLSVRVRRVATGDAGRFACALAQGANHQLRAVGPGGDTVIAQGETIDPMSLTMSGRTVQWTESGQPRQTEVP